MDSAACRRMKPCSIMNFNYPLSPVEDDCKDKAAVGALGDNGWISMAAQPVSLSVVVLGTINHGNRMFDAWNAMSAAEEEDMARGTYTLWVVMPRFTLTPTSAPIICNIRI